MYSAGTHTDTGMGAVLTEEALIEAYRKIRDAKPIPKKVYIPMPYKEIVMKHFKIERDEDIPPWLVFTCACPSDTIVTTDLNLSERGLLWKQR